MSEFRPRAVPGTQGAAVEHLVLEPPLIGVTQDPSNQMSRKSTRAPIMTVARNARSETLTKQPQFRV